MTSAEHSFGGINIQADFHMLNTLFQLKGGGVYQFDVNLQIGKLNSTIHVRQVKDNTWLQIGLR